jgi:hypothetical protein
LNVLSTKSYKCKAMDMPISQLITTQYRHESTDYGIPHKYAKILKYIRARRPVCLEGNQQGEEQQEVKSQYYKWPCKPC